MITKYIKSIPLTLITAAVVVFAGGGIAQAKPVKLVPASHLGWEVDKTTKSDICTTEPECQPGVQSSEPGGFAFPGGVAVNNDAASAEDGDVYVADTINRRVQVLTAAGVFVGMFGWEVNETKVEEAGKGVVTQAEKNLCTAASHDVCKAGVEGMAPGPVRSSREYRG